MKWTLPKSKKPISLRLPAIPYFQCLALCFTVLSHTAAQAESAIQQELALLKERAILAPIDTLERLNKLQAGHPQLSLQEEVLLYERLSYTKFYSGDFEGALRDAQKLESLGKDQRNVSVECLGILSQAYPYSLDDKLRKAESQIHKAEDCAKNTADPSLKIKVLLARALIERDADHIEASLLTLEEAQRISEATSDNSLLFTITYRKAELAGRAKKLSLALDLTDQLISQAKRSKHPERLIRAKLVENWVSSAAGLSARAEQAMREAIYLLRQQRLDERLGETLVDYSNFLLLAKRYAEAEATAREALSIASANADKSTSNSAHFAHATALISLGRIKEGKDEVNHLLKSTKDLSDLLPLLPDYINALSHAGDTEASLQASALQQSIKGDSDYGLSKEKADAIDKIESLAKLSEVKEAEAANERRLRNLWLAIALVAVLVMTAFIALYRRLRTSNGLLKQSNQQLYIASNCDALTGLVNRRYLENHIVSLTSPSNEKTELESRPIGLVLLMDVDNFKKVNDTYGHAAGDAVLQVTAKRLATLFRNEDKVARWGGEEFLAILPNAQAGETYKIVSRILAAVATEPIQINDLCLNVTISIGFCTHGLQTKDKALDWQQVVNLADQGLYLAKKNGRNMAYGITEAGNVSALELEDGLEKLILDGKLTPMSVPGPTTINRTMAQCA